MQAVVIYASICKHIVQSKEPRLKRKSPVLLVIISSGVVLSSPLLIVKVCTPGMFEEGRGTFLPRRLTGVTLAYKQHTSLLMEDYGIYSPGAFSFSDRSNCD